LNFRKVSHNIKFLKYAATKSPDEPKALQPVKSISKDSKEPALSIESLIEEKCFFLEEKMAEEVVKNEPPSKNDKVSKSIQIKFQEVNGFIRKNRRVPARFNKEIRH